MSKKTRKCKVCGSAINCHNKGDVCFIHQRQPRTVYYYMSDSYYQLFLDEEELKEFRQENEEHENVRVVPVTMPGNELLMLFEVDKYLVRKDHGDRRMATDFLTLLACMASDFSRAEKLLMKEQTLKK